MKTSNGKTLPSICWISTAQGSEMVPTHKYLAIIFVYPFRQINICYLLLSANTGQQWSALCWFTWPVPKEVGYCTSLPKHFSTSCLVQHSVLYSAAIWPLLYVSRLTDSCFTKYLKARAAFTFKDTGNSKLGFSFKKRWGWQSKWLETNFPFIQYSSNHGNSNVTQRMCGEWPKHLSWKQSPHYTGGM